MRAHHQHAVGARRGGAVGGVRRRPGRRWAAASQDGFSTKAHLRAEGRGGKPMAAVLTPGERHEQVALEPPLLDCGAVRRPGGGRPRLRLRRVAGDKGYSSPKGRCQVPCQPVRPPE